MPFAQTESIFFPYINAGESLELRPVAVRADGQPVELEVSPDAAALELWRLPWKDAEIEFEVKLTAGAPRTGELVPPCEQKTPDVTLGAMLHCRSTLRRWGVSGSWEPRRDAGRFSVSLTRGELHGCVELVVHLARTREQDEAQEYAAAEGGRLATSPLWRLYVDPSAERFGPGLAVRWEDFPTSKSPWRRANPELLWHLDASGEQPVLFLNEHIEGDLRAILEEQAPSGKKARVRELLFSSIQLAVWPTLLQTALQSVNSEGDVEAGWQRNVLMHVATRVTSDATPDVALRGLIRDLRDPSGGRSVHERVAAALLNQSGLRVTAEALIREGF